ncbi:hypothetical protein MMC10_001228 [Thelotrema lepadinum]|nr:hypothetical protein [Thelotrema lepadinum]
MRFSFTAAVAAATTLLFSSLASAQLSGSVGPTTSTASKAAKKICNVLNYGAKADKSTDLGPPLASAFAACKSGGIVYIPPGDYAMSTWQTLNAGTGWALQLDGTIYRTGTAGGHMIIVENAKDFEFFSQTSKGAMQGYGYQFTSKGTYGPRLVRIVTSSNFAIHDLALVDSPAFHLILDNSSNGEVYNLIIRGGNEGGLDGIDVSGSNIFIHDVEVTNKDECVTIKNPASNMLIQDIYCNWSGGSAMGSLSDGITISNIEYNRIYTWQSNQMYMIKSNGGSGTVKNCAFTNFIGHSNAYALDIDGAWSSQTPGTGSGVALQNLTFSNWSGTIVSTARAPIQVLCANVPCTNINLKNLNFWSDTNSAIHYVCGSAYGSGYCVKSGSGGVYSPTTTSVTSAPSGYNGAKMPNDLASGFALTASIPVPPVPTSFYPGQSPATKLCNGACAGASSAAAAGGASPTTTLKTTAVKTSTASASPTGGSGGTAGCAAVYGQCGGTGWTGATCCASGSTCTVSNEYYSQCL